MKAFLLAAGFGTRLRPYTDALPKCLLPIRNTPMLGIWLSLCRAHGIEEILINTHAHATEVSEFVRKRRDGLRVRIVEERALLGSAGTLRANREFVRNETAFWIFYADVLTCMNLDAMLRFHAPGTAATLGVYPVPDPERCGIVEVDSTHVIRSFIEKPALPESNLAFSGIILGTQQFLGAIPEKPVADIAFDVLPRLVGAMRAYRISEYLLDIGTLQNYRLAQDSWPGLSAESTA
jgi:mannose-1-phosphate guanylyltransferase